MELTGALYLSLKIELQVLCGSLFSIMKQFDILEKNKYSHIHFRHFSANFFVCFYNLSDECFEL